MIMKMCGPKCLKRPSLSDRISMIAGVSRCGRAHRPDGQATDCVMVPVQRPATAAAGSVIVSVGFQVAKLLPTPAVREKAVAGVVSAVGEWRPAADRA